jgi:hypothetical protein
VLQNSSVIALDFLLYLERVNVFRESLNLTPADGVDQACFSNTIAAY